MKMKFACVPVAVCQFAFCSMSFAQEPMPSRWAWRTGPAHVGFSTAADVSINGSPVPGADASASSNTSLGLELSYAPAPRWQTRLMVGIPPTTTLRGEGSLAGIGALGKVTYAPATLTATYALPVPGFFTPYVGAGVNYTKVFSSKDAFIAHFDARSKLGSVLQVGADVPIGGEWAVTLDVKKIFLKTTATGTLPAMGGAAASATVRLDPLVVFLSVGRRF